VSADTDVLFAEAWGHLAAAEFLMYRSRQPFERRPKEWDEPKLTLAEIKAMSSEERLAHIERFCGRTPNWDAE